MYKETDIANLKRIAQDLHKERTSLPTENNDMEGSGIDSFLMFASHEMNDCSIYPYWANLDFENLDDFLFVLFYWNDSFKYISLADNMFIKRYINNNISNIWTYFADKPSFRVVVTQNNFKEIVLMATVGEIISSLDKSIINSKLFGKGLIGLINLSFCDEFVIYFNKLWGDISDAIKTKVAGEKIFLNPKWCMHEDLFTEDNRNGILETLEAIRTGKISLPVRP